MRQRASVVLFAFGFLVPSRTAAQTDHHGAWTFESSGPAGHLVDWSATSKAVMLDSTVVHGGRYAAHLMRSATDSSGGGAAVLSMSLPVDFSGKTLELRGWLKTDSVRGYAGLWLREDGGTTGLQFDNMQDRHLAGTTGWTEYRIQLPLDRRARKVLMGALLVGGGDVWADDLELLVDGKPLEDAPPRAPSPVELDTMFNAGSGIHAQPLSVVQVSNLALLGKVWGFVKYRHPRIVKGDVNWDYELFRVMPEVLRAPDRATADRAMAAWLEHLGDPPPCFPCASLPPMGAYLSPDIAWIHDADGLGAELSRRLELIDTRRSMEGAQYYVSLNPGVGNPEFDMEAAYQHMPSPDAGFRLLALYRFWNIIEYWYPNRKIVGEDWDGVLARFVPRVMAASSGNDYRLAMLQLIALVHDTHANLWSDLAVRPPRGRAQLPVVVRFIQGKAVVTGYAQPELGPASGLRIGDVIESLGGQRVDSLVRAWRPYYADSNDAAMLRDMARTLTHGPVGMVHVLGTRASGPFDLSARRVPLDSLDPSIGVTHDLPGPAFRMLSPDVAYLKLSEVKSAESAQYIERAANAKVLVVDIRNYPKEFVVFSLGGHFVTEPTPFVRFTHGDLASPGAFEWGEPVSLQPLRPHFAGKVVVLVDAVTQSQAEYTTMALRAAGALVVGSTTAGADGNVSAIPLPGGLRTMISGIGVFYPDETPTQRVGIVPDLEVSPTIAGIRAGRDEVLEAAVSHALGHPFKFPTGR